MGKGLRSDFGRLVALVTLSPLVLCLFILVVNVKVAPAQGPSDLKRREDNATRLDRARRLSYHTRFLRHVAKSSPRIEVVWNMEKVLPSLRYIAENGTGKDKDAAKVVGSIFSRTEDDQARKLCFSALKRIGNKEAMREMSRIYHDPNIPEEWHAAFAEYLRIEQPQRSKVIEM